MNLDQLQKKLLAAARANPPVERVPLAFEKRVLAHLQSKPAADVSALWARALWRAVIPCVAVTVVLAALSLVPTTHPTAVSEQDLSQDFEQTLLATAEQLEENW
jgi:anti-sigma-K factor RskA